MNITEQLIDEIVVSYESDKEKYIEDLTAIMEKQPFLLSYLNQESNAILTEEEKDLLWFIVVVMITALQRSEIEIPEIEEDVISQYEDANWEVFQDQKSAPFRDKVTPFFEDTEEEDLLAFVEDSVLIDDDGPITAIGRDVIFIAAKSLMDAVFRRK